MNPQTRSEIRGLLERHGLRPRKRLGQHFLADPNIVRRIIDLAEVSDRSRVVEVGAGTGTLTRALVGVGASVVAYEVDEGLRPLLDEQVGAAADLRFTDVTEVDLATALEGEPWTMVANLPYGVGTPILLDTISGAGQIERFVVMVQREVADRLVAEPGADAYGLPSIIVGLFCDARFGFSVGPQVFVPPPQVGSAVIRLDRRAAPDPLRHAAAGLAAAAFGQRRKMLRSSLRSVLGAPEESLRAAGIDPAARPEELSAEAFMELARVV